VLLALLVVSGYAQATSEVTAVLIRDFRPLSFVNEKTNKPCGFAVELTNAIASRAGLQVRYLMVNNWQEVEESLKNGTADFCPVLAVNEDRKNRFLFTDFVETSGIPITVRKHSSQIRGIADLKGKTAGAIRASQGFKLLKDYPGITVLQFDNLQVALLELLSGHIDALVAPDIQVLQIARSARIEDKIQILSPPLLEFKRAFAVPRNKPELFKLLEKPVAEFVASNDYMHVYTEWYGVPVPFWTVKRVTLFLGSAMMAGIVLFTIWRFRFMHTAIKEISIAQAEMHEKAIQLEAEIAERQKVQEALQVAKEEAEAASKAKSLFLANMSHELRTPLNGVIGMAQLISMTNPTDTQQGYLDDLQLSANNLLALISDILDITKIEAEQLHLLKEDFLLRSCIDEAVLMLRSRLDEKMLNFSIKLHDGVPGTVTGDRLRVLQILSNLLSNAIKFTDKGEVNIEIAVKERYASTVLLDIAVHDTGAGIDPELMDYIFNTFTQADETYTRRHGGAGLGLSLCHKLAELMGGSITVESSVGKGSTFHLLLPCTASSSPPEQYSDTLTDSGLSLQRSLSILLAEDNRENQHYALKLLEMLGHTITVVADGKQAIDVWAQGNFDLILMDIQMPVMCGDEAVRIIRERENGRRIPIIAVTAHAIMGDHQRLLEAGCDGYVPKPFLLKNLASEIQRVVSGNDEVSS
jgi:signal transduction histidine kinase/ActR/RegA family two-component response regulator